jgi:2-haloacid dehalogenase
MDYHWLLFDADGTLFDYDLAETRALQGAFAELALAFGPLHSEAYRRINRQIWADFELGRINSGALRVRRFELLFEALGIAEDAQRFSDRYLVHLAKAGDLIDGAEDVLRRLRGRWRLALITNGLKDVQRPRLEASPIAGLFEVVAISEELGVAKPDPRFFEAVFARIGNPPKAEALVVGDSLTSDIQGGNHYGLDTCWFNPAGMPPDPRYPARYEIRALPELLDLLES